MKTLIIILTVLTTFIEGKITQDLTVMATYTRMEEGLYIFLDNDGYELGFSDIDTTVINKFNLDSEEFFGKEFRVTYKMDTEIDENNEEYDVYIIVDLSLLD